MGRSFHATCRNCGNQFLVDEGGGRRFEQLRCLLCGVDKAVGHAEIGPPFSRYAERLRALNQIDSDEEACRMMDLIKAEYHAAVESMLDKCSCGGEFRFGAPARCPKCRSTDLEPGKTKCYYD